MKTFKEFVTEESTHLEKAHAAMLAGDYESAMKHLSAHVPGKSRRRDAEVAKLSQSIRSKIKNNK